MSRACRRTVPAALLACWAALGPLAHASGFAIFEQGARGMGLAGAYVAQSQDPSAIFHNAAGIAFLKGSRIYFGATLIHPDSKFSGANPFPGDGVSERSNAGVTIPPAFDYSRQLTPRLVVGVGLHVPYGLSTRWANRDSSFSGRFVSKRAQVRSLSINPTLAYKLADRLAVGGGLDVRVSKVELERNVPVVDPFSFRVKDAAAVALSSGNELALGFNLGVLAKPTENLALGIAYRHKVKTDFGGRADFTPIATGSAQLDALVAQRLPAGSVPVTTRITFPALLTIGVEYHWGEWLLAADVDFHQWSSFDTLPLDFEGRSDLGSVVEENYKNSQIYRIGAERRLSERWTLRGGYFFDRSPAPAASVGPILPDASRHCASLGASWSRGRLRVEAANWLLFFKERSTEGQNHDGYNGSYRSFAELFSLSIGLSF